MNEFYCKICNFSTKLKNNLHRHFKTKKHIKNFESNNHYTFFCKYCNHSYKHKQSLYNHINKCKNKNIQNTQCIEINNIDKTLDTFKDLFNSNIIIDNPDFENKIKIIFKEAIKEALPSVKSETIINCKNNYQNIQNIQNNIEKFENNNNINIQVFLNEHCKDAMTIQHFIKNLSIDIDDILNKKHGKFFKGVSDIIIDNLKPLSIKNRPIHCTDIKHSKWMINDEKQGWMEDNGFKIIKKTELSLITHFNNAWILKFPNWEQDEHKKDKWVEIIHILTSDIPDKEIERTLKLISNQCELNSNTIQKITIQ